MSKVTLKASNGEVFEVDETVASMSQIVKDMIEDTGTHNEISLLNILSNVLAKVIEYCNYHVDIQKTSGKKPVIPEEELKQWDAEFVKVDLATLFDFIMAAIYLNIESLMDLTCQTVADMTKGKNPDQIREHFNIKNDFDLEEYEELVKEKQWCFDTK